MYQFHGAWASVLASRDTLTARRSETELIQIATRESRLALWQAEHVRDLLSQKLGLQAGLLGMTTRGDQILDRSLSKGGGKGLFVKELETALEEGRAQLAVHSLKDVPMDLPAGFALASILEREDPRDAFVSNQYASLHDLPQGACVGTSSLRRVVQLLNSRPDLRIEPLRGNLDTRLRKLDEGGYEAIVLAAAGLKRLGLGNRIRSLFELGDMIPCAGQGALGIEICARSTDLAAHLRTLSHQATWLATQAERAVSRNLGGSCSVPLAAHARWTQEGQLHLEVALGSATQPRATLLRAAVVDAVSTDQAALELGLRAAQLLRSQGADTYLVTH